MTRDSWKRKAEALARLAEDQRGKPEGDLAREKLLEIIRRHPDALLYQPVTDLVATDMHIMARDLREIDTTGHWEGIDFADAFRQMKADYAQRLRAARSRKWLEQIILIAEGAAATEMPTPA